MLRKIIKIDEEKCNGCGVCAAACHEGAIVMVNNKARLVRDDYCDGLGDCLPVCPTAAISIEEREAVAYDEAAVLAVKKEKEVATPFVCPGRRVEAIRHHERIASQATAKAESRLSQWPIQLKLVPSNAPYFEGASLLIAADCTAFAYGAFHEDFIKNHITLIGCPKLDEGDYSQKICDIISNNDIKSISIVRMEVPCCGGLENAVKKGILNSGKLPPFSVHTISIEGKLLD